jgi:hypothetical protein
MTRHWAVVMALALVSQPALAKDSHGGGHSGGGSQGGGGGHIGGGGHSGGSGHSRDGGSSGGSHSLSNGGYSSASGHVSRYRSGSTSSSRSGLGLAERRHPPAGTGRGRYPYRYPYYGGYYGGYYGAPFYGSLYFGWPYYYDPFYNPFYYGVSPGYYPPSSDFGYRSEDPGPGMPDEGSVDRGRYDDRDREPAVEDTDSGELLIRAWPRDATVYVDGQFQGTAREITFLHLRPGRHTIEVVRPGFRPEEREVEISRGESRQLAVTLQRP